MWCNSKAQMVMKLKKNLNYDQTQKLILWQNSKTQIVMALKNPNGEKTQPKLWQNSKTQIVTTQKLK